MSVVDEVKSRLDIVDTVSGYVALRKSGRYFKAQCPFHTEKTPSFTVNPERQAWHCFGACATGGDVFSFVMRMERLDFGEALRLLADRAGVPLTERRDRDRSAALRRINRTAVRFYREVLASHQGVDAASYLAQRGGGRRRGRQIRDRAEPRGADGTEVVSPWPRLHGGSGRRGRTPTPQR